MDTGKIRGASRLGSFAPRRVRPDAEAGGRRFRLPHGSPEDEAEGEQEGEGQDAGDDGAMDVVLEPQPRRDRAGAVISPTLLPDEAGQNLDVRG